MSDTGYCITSRCTCASHILVTVGCQKAIARHLQSTRSDMYTYCVGVFIVVCLHHSGSIDYLNVPGESHSMTSLMGVMQLLFQCHMQYSLIAEHQQIRLFAIVCACIQELVAKIFARDRQLAMGCDVIVYPIIVCVATHLHYSILIGHP